MGQFLIAVAMMAALLLTGCDKPSRPAIPSPKFQEGQFVQFALTGQRAQVIRTYCWDTGCRYSVRVAAPQSRTNTHALDADGPIEYYAPAIVNYVREFELRAE